MAWIIGLANDEEIKMIENAGYEVRDNTTMPLINGFANPRDDRTLKGIAVFVDCDVQDLLVMEKEL